MTTALMSRMSTTSCTFNLHDFFIFSERVDVVNKDDNRIDVKDVNDVMHF
jgi:hypothetical protein